MSCCSPSKKPKPEFPPLLPAGLHTLTESDLYALLVTGFKSSTRRQPLWDSLMLFCDELRNGGLIPAKLWLNGSYLTKKNDPDDIDLIVEADLTIMDSLVALGEPIVQDIADRKWYVNPRCLDTYLLPVVPLIHVHFGGLAIARARWERDWGHALMSRQPKGIAVLEVGP